MRIVSGTHKGRPIRLPSDFHARPTTDFAKVSLFNILNNYYEFEGLTVLDLFAGTGSISYEFASRGAKRVEPVESYQANYTFIVKTVQEFKLNAIRPLKGDVFLFLKKNHAKYDVIFADPPYDLEGINTIPDLVFANGMLNDNGMLVIEHSSGIDFSGHPHFKEKREYGSVNFSFLV